MDLSILDRPIAFHRCFVTITESITAALMLSQAVYWQQRTKHENGWWYKTRDEWIEETGMGRYEQEGARRKLRSLGILHEELRGVPAQLWYQIDEERLMSLIGAIPKPSRRRKTNQPVRGKLASQLVENQLTGRRKTNQLAGGKPANKEAGFPPTFIFTETTTETTTTTGTAQTNAAGNSEVGSSSSSKEKTLELTFDGPLARFSPAQCQRAQKILEGLSQETAQQVLDELGDALKTGTIKKSKWAWLECVAQRARDGNFTPTSELLEHRERQTRSTAAVQPPARKSSTVWQQHREELRSQVTSTDYSTYIAAIRGTEANDELWLEVPNQFAAEWVAANMLLIEGVLQPHTPLAIRVCIG